ncbi:MAG: DUF433 domain-containing protein [candidate division Zixibacteria bacterium]|nr:DUF433 domain-containing protein [candidate division Zixibacteria bacterium]
MATTRPAHSKIRHAYITRRKDTCGGKPIIVGTRIKVSQIAIEHDHMGLTADEIIQAHPHLTLAQVHDALSYYYDHIEDIRAEIRESERFIRELRKQYPHSLLEEKRGRVAHLRR